MTAATEILDPEGFYDEKKKPTTKKKKAKKVKVVGCLNCKLAKDNKDFLYQVHGGGGKKILIIRDKPTQIELSKGPYVGNTGSYIRRALARTDISIKDDCWTVYGVGCYKRGNLTTGEINNCRGNLNDTIKSLNPEKILVFGKEALQSLLGGKTSVTGIEKWCGAAIPDQTLKCWIFPQYSPGYILMNENNIPLSTTFKNELSDAISHDAEFPDNIIKDEQLEIITTAHAATIYLEGLLTYPPEFLTFDYETTGIKPHAEGHEIICVSFASDTDKAYAFPIFDDRSFLRALRRVLQSDMKKIAHNIPMEYSWTETILGYKVKNWFWDTLIRQHLLNTKSGTKGLKIQVYRRYGVVDYDDKMKAFIESKEKSNNAFNKMKEAPILDVLKYCAMDSLWTMRLFRDQEHEKRGKGIFDLFMQGMLVLTETHSTGIAVDKEYYLKQEQHLTRMKDRLEKRIMSSEEVLQWPETTAFNFNSSTQLKKLLFEVLGYTSTKQTKGGGDSTDQEALSKFTQPFIKDISQWKKLDKIQGTYVGGFLREQVDGILRPTFPLHTTVSGRGSSRNVNFQNIPVRDALAQRITRTGLKPRPGRQILEVDFKGIEVSISACVVKETKIETIEGAQTIEKIISKINKNEKVYVYGYNQKKERVAVSHVLEGGITKKKAEVWKVTLDNGKTITATPEHNFLLRNGKYIPLQELKKGMSLMPFYKKIFNPKSSRSNYHRIYLNNGESILAHNLIAKDIYDTEIKYSKLLVHHKDGNGCNNNLSNLQIMDRSLHMKIHSIQGWKNNKKEKRFEWKKTKESRLSLSLKAKERYKNLSLKEKEEHKQRVSEGIRRKGDRKGNNNSMFGKKQTEETKKKISEAKKGQGKGRMPWNFGLTKETSEGVALISKKNKGKKAYNKGKKGLYKTSLSTKKKISEKMKGRLFSEETRKKLSANKKKYWLELKQKNEKQTCVICQKQFIRITSTHLKKHDITLKEYQETHNHKVEAITFVGYEDVYNITVDNMHNYATEAGVIIKNCYHKDPNMVAYIEDPTTDMHRDQARLIFMNEEITENERYLTKNTFVFPEFYGDYYKSCAEGLWQKMDLLSKDHLLSGGIKRYSQFESHIKEIENQFWNVRFKVYQQWKKDTWEFYLKHGYVKSLTGFDYYGVMDKKNVSNYPIQGSSFHGLLWSYIKTSEEIKKAKMDSLMIGQIHDAIIFDAVPDELEELKVMVRRITCVDLRKAWDWIIVPLNIDAEISDIDGSWAVMHKEPI